MPSAYTHLKFGQEVLERLPQALSERLRGEDALFRLGLIGPDFLFFYRPAVPNYVISLGRRIHAHAGLHFLAHGADALRRSGFSDRHFAYLCGAICHFVLDSACHGFISAFTEHYDVGHIELENSLDRALMTLDGKNPDKCPLGEFRADFLQSAVMADFYKGLSPKKIRRAVSSAAFYGTLFYGTRNFLGQRLCPAVCDSECRRRRSALKKGREGMMRRYRASVRTAERLISQLEACARGEEKWSAVYRYSFSGKKVI